MASYAFATEAAELPVPGTPTVTAPTPPAANSDDELLEQVKSIPVPGYPLGNRSQIQIPHMAAFKDPDS